MFVISLWCLTILLWKYTVLYITNCFRNHFNFRRFSIKLSWKTKQIQKHENGHFWRSLTPRCDAHCGFRLCGVHHTTVSSSAVCITPQRQVTQISQKTLWCASHRRVKLHGVHHTEESSSAVCITLWSQTAHHEVRIEKFCCLWLLLKGESGEIL